jgi:hypothetical protein
MEKKEDGFRGKIRRSNRVGKYHQYILYAYTEIS